MKPKKVRAKKARTKEARMVSSKRVEARESETKGTRKADKAEVKDTKKTQITQTKEARKNLPKKDWKKVVFSVLITFIWVGASIIVAQLVVGYLMLLLLGPERFEQPVWKAIYSALVYTLIVFLVIFIPKKSFNRDKFGLWGLPTWIDIGLAPVGFFVYLLIAAGLTSLFSMYPWFDAEEVQDIGFSLYVVGFDRIVAFLTLVVVAPIAEEIVFRGFLYGKIRGKLNEIVSDKISMMISILLVSLLFGIVHLQWNVGVNVFAMSIVLCGLREITGTIYSGILLHMLKNGIAFYLLFVLGIN